MLGGRAQQRTTKLFFVVALGVSFAAGCGSPSVKVTDSGADVPTEATTCPGKRDAEAERSGLVSASPTARAASASTVSLRHQVRRLLPDLPRA